MKYTITLLVLGATLVRAQTITPSNPVVNQGGSIRLTADRPVQWSLAPGSAGTIGTDGTYQAPSSVSVKQQAGGCQLLPNNHILNTQVDRLPVHSHSLSWISRVYSQRTGARLNFLQSFPLNLVDDNTPTVRHHFYYGSAQSDGQYYFPALPDIKFQAGTYVSPWAGYDRHLFTLHKRTCNVEEIYNWYPDGGRICTTCTSDSGVKYAASSYNPITTLGTDAAGLPIYPTVLRVDEIERALATGGTIQHALRMTLSNTQLAAAHVWPARTHAFVGTGPIPYGSRLRLKASYRHPSTNPVTQLLIRQAKEYGYIIADGGLDFQIALDDNVQVPPQIRAALNELFDANIRPDQFEFVQQESLKVTDDSGLVQYGTSYAVAEDYAEVIATDPVTKLIRRVPVSLRGATVGVMRTREYIQAGAPAKRLEAWVNGTSDTAVYWTMNPAVPGASLTSDGVFTPPATLSAPVATRLKVTSYSSPSAFAEVIVVILPDGVLRIATGSTANYKDSKGAMWWAIAPGDTFTAWASPVENGWNYKSWSPAFTDSELYSNGHFASQDMRFELHVPNGTYQVLLKMADVQKVSMTQHLECQGKIVHPNVDIKAQAGGSGLPLDLAMPATVTDGKLTFAIRGMSPQGYHSKVSAIQITRDGQEQQRSLRIEPSSTGPLTMKQTRQFRVVAEGMGSAVQWQVVSGPGTISSSGLYTAPAIPQNGSAVVRATSTDVPGITADTPVDLAFGTMSITPNVPSVSPSQTQQFSVLIGGQTYSNVMWQLTGPGTLTATGLYTTPSQIPSDSTITITATSKDDPAQRATLSIRSAAAPLETPAAIRVNAGGNGCGATFTDSLGREWVTDYGFGGSSMTYGLWVPIANTDGVLSIYRCSRYASGTNDFYYSFAVPNATYDVTLRWAEYRTADQGYKMDVLINGTKVLDDFNFVKAAGGVRIAYKRTFRTTVSGGTLRIDFDGQPGAGALGAAINAIEIVPVQ